MIKNNYKFLNLIAKCAQKVTSLNVNSACNAVMHQPKLPANADKLRKF